MGLSPILIFVFTAAISFGGSLQLGIVNTAVIKAALYQTKREAQLTALGGALPEMIYAGIALFSFSILQQRPQILAPLHFLVAPLLFAFGIYLMLKKKTNSEDLVKKNEKTSFLKGFVYGCINPQLLPFWFGILLYLNGFKHTQLKTTVDKIAFILGTSFGAFVLLLVLCTLVRLRKAYFLSLIGTYNLNKLVGSIFIALALLKFIQLVL